MSHLLPQVADNLHSETGAVRRTPRDGDRVLEPGRIRLRRVVISAHSRRHTTGYLRLHGGANHHCAIRTVMEVMREFSSSSWCMADVETVSW